MPQGRYRYTPSERLMKKACNGRREVETIVNEELSMRYALHLTLLEAGAMTIRDDQPAISGGSSTKGARLRVA